MHRKQFGEEALRRVLDSDRPPEALPREGLVSSETERLRQQLATLQDALARATAAGEVPSDATKTSDRPTEEQLFGDLTKITEEHQRQQEQLTALLQDSKARQQAALRRRLDERQKR